jgi:hypothetical protein
MTSSCVLLSPNSPVFAGSMAARPRSLDVLGGEPLHSQERADEVKSDATHGQQLFGIPVGQPRPQVPVDRDQDHVRREREADQAFAASLPGKIRQRSGDGLSGSSGGVPSCSTVSSPERIRSMAS